LVLGCQRGLLTPAPRLGRIERRLAAGPEVNPAPHPGTSQRRQPVLSLSPITADRGKTPVLTTDQARELIESLDTSTLVALRDRALIGVMTYAFARIGAVVAMRVEDYFANGKR
jgi:integrase